MDIDYERLRIAILQQAVKDYEKALRRGKTAVCSALVRWFRSEWGQMLSDDKGELIIAECKRRVRMKKGARRK